MSREEAGEQGVERKEGKEVILTFPLAGGKNCPSAFYAQYNSSLREAAPRRGWRLGRSYAAGFTTPLRLNSAQVGYAQDKLSTSAQCF